MPIVEKAKPIVQVLSSASLFKKPLKIEMISKGVSKGVDLGGTCKTKKCQIVRIKRG